MVIRLKPEQARRLLKQAGKRPPADPESRELREIHTEIAALWDALSVLQCDLNQLRQELQQLQPGEHTHGTIQ